MLGLLALSVALLVLAGITALLWPKRGCVRVLKPVPLLENATPIGLPFEPPLPPNRTLRILEPGTYRFADVIENKQWRAYKVRLDTLRGYLIAEEGITAECQ